MIDPQQQSGALEAKAGNETKPEAAGPPVKLTERAEKRIHDFMRDDSELYGLRLSVSGGGCSGFKYEFGLATERKDGDVEVRFGSAVVLIDPVSMPYVQGAEVDLVENLMGESFQVSNPQATANCGCGESFSV